MLNLETNRLVFKFNGEEVSLRFPTVREIAAHEKNIAGMVEDPEKLIDASLEFYQHLGLKAEIANALELSHVEAISDALRGKKKSVGQN